jgi:aarF domain-containing kinase
LPDFRDALESELDFVNEARNSEKAASLFGKNPNIYIPKIHWKTTTRKIMTMKWVDGVKINDIDGIKQLGMQLPTVSRVLIDLLSEQIFVHGFIHSDPHPGNILVRRKANRPSEPQIVLLDHGLYQSFPDHLRVPYCKLWRALLLRNRDDIEKYGRELGAGEHYNLLSIILSFRPIQKYVNMRKAIFFSL